MLSYTAVSSPAAVACDAGPLLRRLASPAKPECAVRGVFIPGGKIVAPPAATQPPPAGARDELGAARRSSLDLKLVDPLGLEPRPDGLRDRCAAVTPRVNAGKGGGNCIPIIGFGDRGSAVELRPLMKRWSGSRESNSRDRFGRPQPRHSARPASNLVGALGLAPRRSHGRRFYGPLQSLLCQTPNYWNLVDESNAIYRGS
jgi:hypothetical protein